MSEERATYKASASIQDLNALKNRPCALAKTDPNYKPPKPDEVKAFINLSSLNRKQWCLLLGITYNDKKGSTTMRKWTMNSEANDYRQIPYPTWRLMLIYEGVVSPSQDLFALRKAEKAS